MKLFVSISFLLFVVSLNAQQYDLSSGSGIVLTKNGFVATNHHVVDKGVKFYVDFIVEGEKSSYEAKVIQSDEENDLSILKIVDSSFKKLKVIPYELKMRGINVGEKVFVMGFPKPGLQGEEIKVTDGIISSKTGFQNDNKTYQISAPIQPGNSGGPMFDINGNLIGITNAGIPSLQNVGYAIKITYLNNLLDMVPNYVYEENSNQLETLDFTEKIKVLTNYTVMIRVFVPKCDLKPINEKFSSINTSSNLEDINTLFGFEGDNYRNDGSGISYYKWEFCENQLTFIDCWFMNKEIFLSMKTFSDVKCTDRINEENYKKIKPGLTYSEVCKILNTEGERHRSDYKSNINYYKWYDCNDPDSFYDIWFLNNKVHLVRKGNVSQDKAYMKSMMGK